MIFYFILLFVIFLAFFATNSKNRSKNQIISVIILMLLIFLGAFRSIEVGTDNGLYKLNFDVMSMNPDTWSYFTEFEPGFNVMLAIIKVYITDSWYFVMAFLAITTTLFFYRFLKKTTEYVLLALFFFVSLGYYTISWNIMRQCFALTIVLQVFLYCYVENRVLNKKLVWIVFVLFVCIISYLFHRSVIVFLMVPFLNNKYVCDMFSKKWIIYFLLIFSYICVLSDRYITRFVPDIINVLSSLGDVGNRYRLYLLNLDDVEVTVSKITSLLSTAFMIYCVYQAPRYTGCKATYMYLSVVSVFLFNSLGPMSNLFLRISTNLGIFKIPFFVSLWKDIPANGNRLVFRIFVILYSIVLFTNTVIKNFGDIVPYSFYF